jgi:hypothetical protein
MPSSILGASLLEKRNERHDLNALRSGRRIERILAFHLGTRTNRRPVLASGRTERDGRGKDGVIDGLALGRRRLFFGLGGRRREMDSLQHQLVADLSLYHQTTKCTTI